ncbi:MAG: indolepyruvate ferredoxin oxidoreductase family protein [Pseudomonadota bacterium]
MASRIRLDDKYALPSTRAYLTGIEALVRLPILQHQRDVAVGLNTAGFISGYRGSPLGGVDQALGKAQRWLDEHHIHFQPGVNEELAATAVWGSQQVNLFPGAKYDGVFSLWYGKGPGVDRSMDAIKHANAFGTSAHGGVLAVAGDDHACKSSTLPHQSDHMFVGASIPVLSPANVQEVLDYGLHGWAMSRYSGCWVGLKAITENMDSAMPAVIDPERVSVIVPTDFELPEEGVHGRWPSTPLDQERILNKYRIYAARHYAAVNGLNEIKIDSPQPRLGIITTGKSYLDVLQALDDLGIDAAGAAQIGLRVFKLGMPWPLEPTGTHSFADGLEEILVVEEKRSLIEDQLTGQLYNWPVSRRPRVVGEFDERGADLLPNTSELTPAMVARAIAQRIGRFYDSATMRERLSFLEAKERTLDARAGRLDRTPHFCSGCPHNRSTVVPEGSRALGGIGCHYMATWMERGTDTFTQMGGEGATWIGQAPFTKTSHVFQNLGDGTYFHSGLLAIRAAHAAGVNITYKILYNDAVAMTGGQAHDGPLTVPMIVEQVRAEGIQRIAVVSDEPIHYRDNPINRFPGLTIDHRDALDSIQRELRETKGTTVIIYDQTCAAEKRRRRKAGTMVDPDLRVFINDAVCEGCGDCGKQSNCLAIVPKETELGRKRAIDQSACNKDASCVEGFCPSFVTVRGAKLRKSTAAESAAADPAARPASASVQAIKAPLPNPAQPSLERPWNVLVAGVGGSGVLTIGGILGMAAHLEHKGCTVLNQTGLAQKFGAVTSHVRIGAQQDDIFSARIPAGDADLLLGCDLVVAQSDDVIAKLHPARSHALVNAHESPTAAFVRDPDTPFPADAMREFVSTETRLAEFIEATRVATGLLGDAIAGNLFLLGYALQRGWIPLSSSSIDEAIALNGVAVAFNRDAFYWGRRYACGGDAVEHLVNDPKPEPNTEATTQSLDALITARAIDLCAYQNSGYAALFEHRVAEFTAALTKLSTASREALVRTYVASLYKLMAYKDEYEVARLFTDGRFEAALKAQFEGDLKLTFHLAPPVFNRINAHTGRPAKRRFPGFTLLGFRLLRHLKFLRGTRFDPFGTSDERRQERALPERFATTMRELASQVDEAQLDTATQLAALPLRIRGYGPVKAEAMAQVEVEEQRLRALLNLAAPAVPAIPLRAVG